MVSAIPRFALIRSVSRRAYAYQVPEEDSTEFLVTGSVYCNQEDVWNVYAKVEIQTAKIDSKYVNIRSCQSNKYWARFSEASNGSWIFPRATKPEEDATKWTSTLFEPIEDANGLFFYLVHVAPRRLRLRPHDTPPWNGRLQGDNTDLQIEWNNNPFYGFELIDWERLVKLPQHVAFKGYNDKYLKSVTVQGGQHLQFSSDDPYEEDTGYEITTFKDGHVRIYSKFDGKFWRRTASNWILADSTDANGTDNNTLFWPVKVNENTIALRSAVNSRFCKAFTADGRTNSVSAISGTISVHAKFKVEELVLDRFIFRVRFHMDDAYIHDEHAFLAGSGTAINNTDHDNEFTINISFEDSSSYSFGNSVSVTSGVDTSFSVGIPKIGIGMQIETSGETTEALDWNTTVTETKAIEAKYTAVVPAMSIVKVDYVGTRALCDIPFTYNQRDKSSTDGSFHVTERIDGVFTGVNYFDFHFEQPKVYPV